MNYKPVELLRRGLVLKVVPMKVKIQMKMINICRNPEKDVLQKGTLLNLTKKKTKTFLHLPVSASSPLSKQLLTSKLTSSFNCLPLPNAPSTSVLTKPTKASSPTINNELLTSNTKYSENGKDL